VNTKHSISRESVAVRRWSVHRCSTRAARGYVEQIRFRQTLAKRARHFPNRASETRTRRPVNVRTTIRGAVYVSDASSGRDDEILIITIIIGRTKK